MSISGTLGLEAPEPEKPKEKQTTTDPKETAGVTAPTSSPTTGAPSPTTVEVIDVPADPTASMTPAEKYAYVTDKMLERMGDIGEKANFKILIYGPPGGTKSSFLGGVDDLLVYDQEDGLISMNTAHVHTGRERKKNIKAIPFTSFEQGDMLVDRLINNAPQLDWVKVFAIDTINDFHKKSLRRTVLGYHNQRPSSVNAWVPEVDHHQENNEKVLDFVRKLRDLPRDIILLAHSKTVEPKNKPAITYPDFSESLASKIEAMMDIVGYMEMHEIEGKPTPILRVITNGTVHAKTRIPLPAVIADPTYDQLRAEWSKWQETKEQ